MGQKDHRGEQRAEPRFPLHFSASLRTAHNGTSLLSGQMRNISMHGIMLDLSQPLKEYENVDITFHVPQLRNAVRTKGIVKWCRKKAGAYNLGVRFLEPTSFVIPFHHMCLAYDSVLQRSLTNRSGQTSPPAGYQLHHFNDELYCGLFVSIFNKYLHRDVMKLMLDTDVMSFYLHNIADGMEKGETKESLAKFIQEAMHKASDLKRVSENFIDLLKKRKKDVFPPPGLEEKNDLDSILTCCIDTFKQSLDNLGLPASESLTYTAHDAPRLGGSADEYYNCLDYLILFSYQSICYRRANRVKIELKSTKDAIHVDFINDGSQMLHEREVLLDPFSFAHIADHHPKDQKNIVWLCYAISVLENPDVHIHVQSESGHNSVSLLIPLQTVH